MNELYEMNRRDEDIEDRGTRQKMNNEDHHPRYIKTFEKLQHQRFLHKLSSYGVFLKPFSIIKSFITGTS